VLGIISSNQKGSTIEKRNSSYGGKRRKEKEGSRNKKPDRHRVQNAPVFQGRKNWRGCFLRAKRVTKRGDQHKNKNMKFLQLDLLRGKKRLRKEQTIIVNAFRLKKKRKRKKNGNSFVKKSKKGHKERYRSVLRGDVKKIKMTSQGTGKDLRGVEGGTRRQGSGA